MSAHVKKMKQNAFRSAAAAAVNIANELHTAAALAQRARSEAGQSRGRQETLI